MHWSLLKSDIYFWFSGAPKKSLRSPDHFRSPVIWWRTGRMHHDLAQFVDHGRLLNLFFGSSQTDDWLSRYGHFKFWLTCLDMACKLCVNSVKLTKNIKCNLFVNFFLSSCKLQVKFCVNIYILGSAFRSVTELGLFLVYML